MEALRSYAKKIVTLNPELASGGEGKIYEVQEDPKLLAKIFHEEKRSPERLEKLQIMVTHIPNEPLVKDNHISFAWPIDLLKDIKKKQVIGFLMPYVKEMRPVIEFYNPGRRRRNFPGLNYRYLLRMARNLASVFHAIHKLNYVIGDVNELNALASEIALMTLVDTDSFQVTDEDSGKVYRCTVGKPGFTPPELQGRPFKDINRDIKHDRFGLAVLIFLLLMEGVHPFEGVFLGRGDPPPYHKRIADGHFPHGRYPVPYKPKPQAPAFKMLAPLLQKMFLSCFEDGHNDPTKRPSAESWRKAIRKAEENLQVCPSNQEHFYGKHLDECPWCKRILPSIQTPTTYIPIPIEDKIIDALKAKSPQSTTELAKNIKEIRDKVYRICIRLKRQGQISSFIREGGRLFIFSVTGEVVHVANYSRCLQIISDLKDLIKKYRYPLSKAQSQLLKIEIKEYFRKLYRRLDLSPYRSKMKKSEIYLFYILQSARKKSDIHKIIGMRPFGRSKQRFWTLP